MVTSRCHGSKISGSQQTLVLQIWQKNEKQKTCMTFPGMVALRIKIVAHTFFPLYDNANGRLYEERLWRSVQKFCYHVNVMSHFSSILGDKSVATYFARGKKKWI